MLSQLSYSPDFLSVDKLLRAMILGQCSTTKINLNVFLAKGLRLGIGRAPLSKVYTSFDPYPQAFVKFKKDLSREFLSCDPITHSIFHFHKNLLVGVRKSSVLQ
jgi:hypothetical protein